MKKAQSQIITTVLIILLVLAAVVIVWQIVDRFVVESASEIPRTIDCLDVDLEIVSASTASPGSASHLVLKRGVGKGDLVGIKVFINDVDKGSTLITIGELEQKIILFTIATADKGENVKIAKLIGESIENSRLCDFEGKSSENGVVIG